MAVKTTVMVMVEVKVEVEIKIEVEVKVEAVLETRIKAEEFDLEARILFHLKQKYG